MTAGLSHFGFDVDLREGQASEGALVDHMLQSRVEVKDERRQARRTGNVFIEVSQPDRQNPGQRRPSGIYATTAHRWAFRLADDVWVITTTEAVRTITEFYIAQGATCSGGDYDDFEGVLVPLKHLVTGSP